LTVEYKDATGQAFHDACQIRSHPLILFQTLRQIMILVLKFAPEPTDLRLQLGIRCFQSPSRLREGSESGRECPPFLTCGPGVADKLFLPINRQTLHSEVWKARAVPSSSHGSKIFLTSLALPQPTKTLANDWQGEVRKLTFLSLSF
jgi:hypothetical protein